MIDFNAPMCIHHIYRVHMTICDIENCVELYVQVQDNHYTINEKEGWGKTYGGAGVGEM